MKYLILFILTGMLFSGNIVSAQADKKKLYDPELDGMVQFEEALEQAKEEGKHVFLHIGGNWCPWCFRFEKFVSDDSELDSLLQADFVIKHISYGGKNKNLPLMGKLGMPQRFGFPVIVITDAEGNRLHTQDTGYLEAGGSYDREKMLRFFKNWRPEALNPKYNR
jgi:thioredoxin-related protein